MVESQVPDEGEGVYVPPEPAPRGAAPAGVRLERHKFVDELLVSDQAFEPGDLVLRERFLILGPSELPPLGMFQPPPSHVGDTELEGEGFPRVTTFDTEHMKLLLEFMNSEPEVQAEVLAMQDAMEPGCETARCIGRVAKWLIDQQLPWLEGLSLDVLSRLLRLFCVNSHPCRAAGKTSGLLKWGTMINHSCRPNVVYSSVKTADGEFEGHFRAIRRIEEGEVLGVTYMKTCVALGSLAHRRRMLWVLKGFVCHCPQCVHDASHGDRARALKCPACKETCEEGCGEGCRMLWGFRAGVGTYGFTGTRCGAAASDEAAKSEAELSAAAVGAMMAKWNGYEAAEKATAELCRLCEASLHPDHFARRGLRLLLLSLEGQRLASAQRAEGRPRAVAGEARRWLREVWEAEQWLRRVRPYQAGGGVLLMQSFAGLAQPVLDLAGAESDAAEGWLSELRGWAAFLLSVDSASFSGAAGVAPDNSAVN